MGYGSRAIDLLLAYFQGHLTPETLHPASGLFGGEGKGSPDAAEASGDSTGADGLQGEEIKPKAKLPPLLTPIAERPAELLHWFGTSFGLTAPLLTFWSRKGFKVCYLRQTRNELTGEHSAICLRELEPIRSTATSRSKKGGPVLMDSGPAEGWLATFVKDYRRRLISLMGYSFNSMEAPLAITLLDPDRNLTGSNTGAAVNDSDDFVPKPAASATGVTTASMGEAVFRPITAQELLSAHLSHHDMQRLELYSRNMVDHHMILDTLPVLTTLLFQGRMPEIRLSYSQVAIILATGLQHRDVDSVAAELNLPANQVLAFFNKTVRKISSYLRGLVEADAALSLPSAEQVNRIEKNLQGMNALAESLDADQRKDEREFNAKLQQRELIMTHKDLTKHAIKADATQLEKALNTGMMKQLAVPKVISVPKVVAVLPDLSADDLAEPETADAGASSKKSKKDKKEKRKREAEGDAAEDAEEEAEVVTSSVTPAKAPQQQQVKAQTDKKKDKGDKKAKRESF
jgi:N-acetyltransferase 10